MSHSVFRCTSTWTVPTYTSTSARMRILQELRCEGHRWHTGWHHSTWTWWPTQTGQPAEHHNVEWSGEPDHPFERETAYPTLGMYAAAELGEIAVGPVAETSVPRPMITVSEPDEDAVASSPLMKAHLALIQYGMHAIDCDPGAMYGCTCGLAQALRETCPAPEEHHG
jgi:hypothetical protein